MKNFAFLSIALCCFLFVNSANGQVIFQDDFEDGNTDGWSFAGNGASEWGVLGGISPTMSLNTSVGNSDAHDAILGVGYLTGIEMPSHFKMSVDVSVVTRANGSDFGHAGFVWGFDGDTFTNGSDTSGQYLRTHADQVTTFSRPYTGEYLFQVGSVTNDTVYNMMVEVDYGNRLMEFTFDNTLMTSLSGNDFDTYLIHSSGNVGLVNWGEEVTYDNFVLTAIPEPSAGCLVPIVFAVCAFRRRRLRI